MNLQPPPLDQLSRALTISQRMLQLARSGDWDGLVDCELERREVIASLRAFAQDAGLVPDSAPARDDALRIMAEIIDADRQTEELVKTWMSRIAKDLGELDLARKVGAAYGVR